MKSIDSDRTARRVGEMLQIGAVASQRLVSGSMQHVVLTRSSYLERLAFEGINPFVQDEHEIRFQCQKAGYET